MQQEKRAVTPDMVIKIYKKKGKEISVKDAEIILDFLYKFGKLVLTQAFNP